MESLSASLNYRRQSNRIFLLGIQCILNILVENLPFLRINLFQFTPFISFHPKQRIGQVNDPGEIRPSVWIIFACHSLFRPERVSIEMDLSLSPDFAVNEVSNWLRLIAMEFLTAHQSCYRVIWRFIFLAIVMKYLLYSFFSCWSFVLPRIPQVSCSNSGLGVDL